MTCHINKNELALWLLMYFQCSDLAFWPFFASHRDGIENVDLGRCLPFVQVPGLVGGVAGSLCPVFARGIYTSRQLCFGTQN